MFEYVNTSVPNGLLPGTHGFCGVAMTRDLPEPVRRRLESFSSYTHLAPANGPDYLRLNPISWSHFVLDGGEHVLGCVRAAPFDYTGRTNRLARFWFFQPAEVPTGLNPADAILQGGNSASLSDAWSGEPRWLAPRTSSPLSFVAPRTDVRPAAWMQTFGDADGPRLAAAFSVLLAERIRVKGRPLIFLAAPAAHGDGSLLLSLFADLIALLPPPLRAKATFSTYPVALSTSMTCHLRGEFGDATRLLAGETAWIDLRARRVHGAETAAVPPELLFLATHGYEQPPEPVIRGGASGVPARSQLEPVDVSRQTARRTGVARKNEWRKPPVGRVISRNAGKKRKERGIEDYLLWAIGAALLAGVLLLIGISLKPTSLPDTPETTRTPPTTQPPILKPEAPPPEPEQKRTTSEPEPEPAVPEEETPAPETEAPVEETEKTPDPAPEEQHPLLMAQEIKVVRRFDPHSFQSVDQADLLWFFYEQNASILTSRPVEKSNRGFRNEPEGPYVILLLNKKKGIVHWKWHVDAPRNLFKNNEIVNLRHGCFGKDEILFSTWKRCKPEWRESYDLSTSWDRACFKNLENDSLAISWFVSSIQDQLKNEISVQKPAFEKEVTKLQAQKSGLESKIAKSEQDIGRHRSEIETLRAEIERNTLPMQNAKKKDKKPFKDKIAECNRHISQHELEIQKITNDQQLKLAKRNLESLDEKITQKKASLDRLTKTYDAFSNPLEIEKKLREISFSIEIFGKDGPNEQSL